VTALAGEIAAAFIAACRDELDAPKPGNVHVLAAGNRKTAADFVRSAEAAAPPLTEPGARIGARIFRAVEATAAAVPRNTNLGIILLCAPMAAAAERAPGDLRAALAARLDSLDVEDARLAFKAITLAAPGGLGTAPRHDVREPAAVTLRQAMAEAADRDRIARQYVSGFADVFDLGEPLLASALSQAAEPKWATLAVYLGFLSAFADTHVAREHGPAIAEEVRRQAETFHARMRPAGDMSRLLPDLMAWDTALKHRGINPGTSADLTVATLFAHRLRSILPRARNSD
jgi:triphosphoribosyl-dephospho-CoA synthase